MFRVFWAGLAEKGLFSLLGFELEVLTLKLKAKAYWGKWIFTG